MSPVSFTPRDAWICLRHGVTHEPCPCLTRRVTNHDELSKNTQRTEYQHFWCCAHHPSAIQNFFEKRHECEWECHTQELKWYHSGKNPMPKSWGTPHGQDR